MPNGGSPAVGCQICLREFTIYGHDGLGDGAGLPVITSHHHGPGPSKYVGRFTGYNVFVCFGCKPLEAVERARWIKDYNNVPPVGTRE